MARHGYLVEGENDKLVIIKGKRNSQSVKIYIFWGLGLFLIGVAMMLLLPVRSAGGLTMGAAVFIFGRAYMLRQRELDAKKKSVELSKGHLSIRDGYKGKNVKLSATPEIRQVITEQVEDLLSGVLYLAPQGSNHSYELIEIYGDNKEYLEDDLKIITNYLTAHLDGQQPSPASL